MEAFSKPTMQKYYPAFTDDVVWEMPGFFHLTGKAAFDGEIENDAFTGSPHYYNNTLCRRKTMLLYAKVLCKAKRKMVLLFHAVFCDMFEMEGGKIKKLTSYVMVKPEAP